MLQYAVQIAILRFSFISLKEFLKFINNQSELPPMPKEYVDMHTPEIQSNLPMKSAPMELKRDKIEFTTFTCILADGLLLSPPNRLDDGARWFSGNFYSDHNIFLSNAGEKVNFYMFQV